jgi:predicted DNA-binding protein (UPF0251 family)
MSLIANPALPMSKSRRPGRPSGRDEATRQMHLRALNYLMTYDMKSHEVARLMGYSRMTIHRWVKKAIEYPEANQIFTRETPEIGN